MKKVFSICMAVMMAVSMLAACSSANSEQTGKQTATNAAEPSKNKKFRIAFVPGTTANSFYISMKYSAEELASKLGIELIWTGVQEWDYVKQTAIVNGLVESKVDAIVITPTDDKEMVAPLKKAMDAGIAVFTVDTNVSDESAYIANVASNNKQGGRNAADLLAELIGKKGKVAILNSVRGNTALADRQAGFEEQIHKYPNIRLIAAEYSEDKTSIAEKKMRDIAAANPDIAGVFATNLPTGQGVAQALRASELKNKVKLVSYDAGPETVEALKNNTIQAIISQKPGEMAKIALQNAYDYLNGKKDIVKQTLLGNIPVTPESVGIPAMKNFLYRSE